MPFIDLEITSHGCGHPPQQFLCQPAVEYVLREGVQRFPHVDVLLEHECLRVLLQGGEVELMLADLCTDAFKRLRRKKAAAVGVAAGRIYLRRSRIRAPPLPRHRPVTPAIPFRPLSRVESPYDHQRSDRKDLRRGR